MELKHKTHSKTNFGWRTKLLQVACKLPRWEQISLVDCGKRTFPFYVLLQYLLVKVYTNVTFLIVSLINSVQFCCLVLNQSTLLYFFFHVTIYVSLQVVYCINSYIKAHIPIRNKCFYTNFLKMTLYIFKLIRSTNL